MGKAGASGRGDDGSARSATTPRTPATTPDPEKPRGSAEPIPGRCGARLRGTDPPRYCKLHPVPGGARCTRFHGGKAPQVRAAAAVRYTRDQALAAARSELARLGGAYVDLDPLDGLLDLYREAAWNVEVLRVAIGDLRPVVDEHGAIAIPEQVVHFEKGGTHVPAAEHILVAMYDRERDRAARYAKLCLEAGVEERRVKVAEQDAQRLGRAFGAALDDVGDLMSSEARTALQKALAGRLRELVG